MKKRAIIILLNLVVVFLPSLMALKADFQFSHVCFHDTTSMWNTSIPSFGDSIQIVQWDLNGNGKFGDASGDSVRVFFDKPGINIVGMQVITYNGEMDAVYKSIPIVDMTPAFSYDYCCLNLPVHFYDETTIIDDVDEIIQYHWSFGDGTTKDIPNPTHNYFLTGAYVVKMVVTSRLGCRDSVGDSIQMKNPPVVDVLFSGDTVFPLGDSVIATISGSTFDSIFWSTEEQTPSITIKNTGYYFVQGFLSGCYGEYSFSVTAIEDNSVRVMTLFTPNDDGFNDRWEIINIQEVAPCSVDVFDRWGEKVFSASPYNNDWDGKYKGRSLSNDTYYYFLRCQDGRLQKGYVNILK